MSFRRWVVWDPEEKNESGKQTKTPRIARDPNKNASTRRPWNWASWEEVQAVQQTNPTLRAGYVLSDDDTHAFLDLDGCRDPASGAISDWAHRILQQAKSYTEITPSGTGLRIIGLVPKETPSLMRVLKAHLLPGGPPQQAPDPNVKAAQIEIYFRTPRYVTVSGWQLPGTQEWGLAPIADTVLELAALAPLTIERERNPEMESPIEDIRAAVQFMSNPPIGRQDTWETYNTVAMAIYAASSGSEEGLECINIWSSKHPKYDGIECYDRWDHWHISPPTRLSGGTLTFLATEEAKEQGFQYIMPSRQWPANAPPLTAEQLGLASPTSSNTAQAERLAITGPPPAEPKAIPWTPPVLVPLTPDQLPKEPIVLLDYDTFAEPYKDKPEFLVEGLLMRNTTVMITGLPGSAKSPLFQCLAAHVAMGQPWCGMNVEQGRVVWIAAESADQTAVNIPMFAAGILEEANQMEPFSVDSATGRDMIRKNIMAIDHNLTLERDTHELIRAIEKALGPGGPWEGCEPDLIVLDTLRQMSMGGVNSDEDMALVQSAVGMIRAKWRRATVVFIHHAAKSSPEGSSGTNRLDAMANTILNMVMLPPGADAECEEMLLRIKPWGDPLGEQHSAFRLTMGRQKRGRVMLPTLVTMTVRDDGLRFNFNNRNPLLTKLSKAALHGTGTVFKDERPKKVTMTGVPIGQAVAAQEGDDGAFAAGDTIEAKAPTHAANAGAAMARTLVAAWLEAHPGWHRTRAIMDWLRTVEGMAAETRIACGLDLQGKRALDALGRHLRNMNGLESRKAENSRGSLEWRLMG